MPPYPTPSFPSDVARDSTLQDVDDKLAGTLNVQSASGTWDTVDQSPPFTALAHIGVDVDPDTDTTVAPAGGRAKIDLCHAGDAGRVWIGVGQAAQVGVGDYLDPGDAWSEFTGEAVHVWLHGTATPQRVTGVELAA